MVDKGDISDADKNEGISWSILLLTSLFSKNFSNQITKDMLFLSVFVGKYHQVSGLSNPGASTSK